MSANPTSVAAPGFAGLPADYAFTVADAGAHTFPAGLTLRKSGTRTVFVRDTTVAATNNGSP